MKLFLVRHGQAVAEGVNPQRPLTEQGKQDTQKVAGLLNGLVMRPRRIISSRKLRAVETAQILSQSISAACEQRDGLSPNDTAENIKEEIETQSSDLMIVGHLPFLERLTALLLTGKNTGMRTVFYASSVVCLDRNTSGTWQLLFFIYPDMVT